MCYLTCQKIKKCKLEQVTCNLFDFYFAFTFENISTIKFHKVKSLSLFFSYISIRDKIFCFNWVQEHSYTEKMR